IRAVDYLGVSMITQILTVPVYVVVFVATISMALSSDHHIERGLHYAGPVVVSAVGYILIVTEDSSPVWHIGLPVATAGSFSSVPAITSWFSTNIGGHTKRAVAIGFIISVGNLDGAIGGQVYRGNGAANRYVRHATCAVAMVCSVFMTLTMKWLLARENKRRSQLLLEEYEQDACGKHLRDNHLAFRYWT
ncbi:hypothetical protein CPB97_001266, partial [Podila verticillata]